MNVTPKPATTAALTDSCRPSSSRGVEVAQPRARAAQLVLDHLPDAGALLHHDQRLLAQLVERDRPAREPVPGRDREHDLVAEERLEDDAAVAARGADDAELELALGDLLDDALRVGDRERDVRRRGCSR